MLVRFALPALALTLLGGIAALAQQPAAAPPAAPPAAAPAADGEKEGPSVWMQRKLNYSREILAGIASADFDQIVQNAEAMNGLSRVEAFARGRTPGYRTQLGRFNEANEEIIAQAKRDNVHGAALGFQQLVNSCVQCHEQLRRQEAAPATPRR